MRHSGDQVTDQPELNIIIIIIDQSELQSELERNVNETHHLETTRKNLERALAETEGPMRVNAECIYNR